MKTTCGLAELAGTIKVQSERKIARCLGKRLSQNTEVTKNVMGKGDSSLTSHYVIYQQTALHIQQRHKLLCDANANLLRCTALCIFSYLLISKDLTSHHFPVCNTSFEQKHIISSWAGSHKVVQYCTKSCCDVLRHIKLHDCSITMRCNAT